MVLFNKQKIQSGFIMVEVILGVALAAILLLAFTQLLYRSSALSVHALGSLKAQLYITEVIEIARELEGSSWSEISSSSCIVTSPCHPEVVSGNWTIISGAETLDGGRYTRSFYIENVYRNQLAFPNEIVTTGGIDDPDTKKIVATVSWNSPDGANVLDAESYVYNF